MWANLCLLLVSCLVGISLCEVSLRFFSPKYRHLAEARFSQDARRVWARSANYRDSIGGPDNFTAHAWHHNNLALRQHRNFSEADLAAAANIGVFGDSFVENIGMDAPYSFTEPLDYLLNQGRTRFNVLNFGVYGYGPGQSFLHYENFRYVNELDYVLYVYSDNDISDIGKTRLFRLDETGRLRRNEIIRPWWAPLIGRLYLSYLILDATGRLSSYFELVHIRSEADLRYLISPKRRQSQPSEYRKDKFPIFQQLIRRWKSRVETRGSTFYVVMLPNHPVDPFLASVFAEEGVEVISLYDCFGDHDPAHLRLPWDESPYRFRRDGHWNEAGNHLAAVCLYRVLEEKAGPPPLTEDGLREALSRYYSAFGGWSPTDLGGGDDVSPQTLAGIREKYQAFDEVDFFEATWRAMRAAPDKRIIEADLDVYMDGSRLVYLKEACGPTDLQGRFFLHLTPVDEQDLPMDRTGSAFRRRFHFFDHQGVRLSEDRCIMVRYLPPWPLHSIRTGQYQYVRGERRLWAREYSLDQKKSGEAVMEVMPSEKRIIHAPFDVYLDGENLVYVKEEGCRRADKEATFFLQVTPVDGRVLAPDLRPQGFDTTYFNRCTKEVTLPSYDIRHIRTGQFVPNVGRLWEGEYTMGPARVDEGAPKGRLAGKRIIQSTFDVYLQGGRLIYRKEQCNSTVTQARFFLHVTPVDKNDLSPERAQYGFTNMDFRHWSKFRTDEFGCRIAHRLPAYAVRSIKTGQYLPGEEGLLWEREFSFD